MNLCEVVLHGPSRKLWKLLARMTQASGHNEWGNESTICVYGWGSGSSSDGFDSDGDEEYDDYLNLCTVAMQLTRLQSLALTGRKFLGEARVYNVDGPHRPYGTALAGLT